MTLRKVISGFQTGVDEHAVYAAHSLGIETGGWIPKGWRTLRGPRPDLKEFGAVEHASSTWRARAYANVLDSDATLRIADDYGSPGEICTMQAIKTYMKPHLEIHGVELPRRETVLKVAYWIRDNKIAILNVAGNSERTAPGIGVRAEMFLREVFSSFGVKAKD